MRFLIDAQLPPALVGWLIERGHEAAHVHGSVGANASDQQVWDAALSRDAVILTKDRDFAQWSLGRRPHPQVVWIRLGNATAAALCAWLESRWLRIESELLAGATLVEVGRP